MASHLFYVLLSLQFHVGQIHRKVTVQNVETAVPGPGADSIVCLSMVHGKTTAVESLAQGPNLDNRQYQDAPWTLVALGTS